MIDNFFKEVVNAKIEMQKALKKYIEANDSFYSLTGIKYSEMPKVKGQALGFDDLMANIEEIYTDYLKKEKEYNIKYQECMGHISKLDNQVHRLIIEYTYIDRKIDKKSDKETLRALQDYHNIDISYSYFRIVKSNAKREFRKIIPNTL